MAIAQFAAATLTRILRDGGLSMAEDVPTSIIRRSVVAKKAYAQVKQTTADQALYERGWAASSYPSGGGSLQRCCREESHCRPEVEESATS